MGAPVRLWESHAMETLEPGQQIIVDELAAKVSRNQVYYDCWASAMLLKVEVKKTA